ncbi:LytTR family DNA-binding domain-containing protein [Aliiglaciecola sp. CAU 1673]|uniref:LytR/AlgR family response regulator transcription factor n=1 Tax=Aliiglaciecola sp. CAU 1673 TaxID=3032595 RepID=UPI0023DABD3C|nr:LytTR family DNA-binding domain-containing protein [Aliiglaciecola sp. CAU 1673]MDF2178652.1 LytTR family DNA-binding domain-containing protein [Aliiglaciecola sp. CAU 1673]
MRLLFLISLLLSMTKSFGQDAPLSIFDAKLHVCKAHSTDAMADFSAPDCNLITPRELDPQQQALWVKTHLGISPKLLNSKHPIGLYVSGKMASKIYLNGTELGSNGTPGLDKNQEVAGQMDRVFYVPRELLNQQSNELVLLLSGWHSQLSLAAPVHGIFFGTYEQPQAWMLRHYWPSFTVSGALLLASLYLLVLGANSAHKGPTLALAWMALMATLQLFSEVSRALWPYSYPWHDLRLLGILFCVLSFCIGLLYHLLARFWPSRRWSMLLAGTILVVLGAVSREGFDDKSSTSVLIACLLGLNILLWRYFQGRHKAMLPMVILSLFGITVLFSPSQFLDTNFYFLLAGLMLLLAHSQATSLVKERSLRKSEQQRAEQLALTLTRLEAEQSPQTLSISSAGNIEQFKTDQLLYCKSDRDYVEFMLDDGRLLLDSASSLATLEESLPGTFLRVHRSYLVNTDRISSLDREPNGTGILTLDSKHKVPVSRRIMPKVREAVS